MVVGSSFVAVNDVIKIKYYPLFFKKRVGYLNKRGIGFGVGTFEKITNWGGEGW